MTTTVYAEDILDLEELKPSSSSTAPREVAPVYAEDIMALPVVETEFQFDSTPAYVEKTLAERLLEKRDKRIDKVSQYVSEAFAPTEDQSLGELLSRPGISGLGKTVLGNAAGTFMDVSGELVMEGIDLIVPDSIEAAVKDKMVQAFNYISSNDYVAGALDAAREGVESYNEWRNENPTAATELESVVDLGTFFLPPAARKSLTPAVIPEDPLVTKISEAAQGQIDKLSQVFKRSAARQIAQKKLEKAYDLIMPVQLKEDRLKDATPSGLFRDAKIEPNPLEAETIEHIAKMDINPSKGYLHNWKVIEKANKKEAELLNVYLKAKGRDKVIPQVVTAARVNRVLQRVAKEPLAQTQDAQRILGGLAKDIDAIIKASGNKPTDLLQLRKDIDAELAKKFKFFEKEQPVWLDNAGREIRQEINSLLNDVVGGDFVKQSLRKQHLNFTAQKGLASKAAKETDRKASILYKNLGRLLGDNVRMSRLVGLSTLGASGYASIMGVLPWITTAGIGVGLGAIAMRGTLSPAAKKAMGYTLDATNEALKVATDPRMIKELRAGRSMLLEISQLPVDESLQEEEIEPEG